MGGLHRCRLRGLLAGAPGIGPRRERPARGLVRPRVPRRPQTAQPRTAGGPGAAPCQLLSFLAVAARAQLDVVAYQDRAEGEMPEDDEPMRITTIRLRPEITARDRQRSGSPSWSTSPTASATWPTACAPMSWSNPRSSSCECGVNHRPGLEPAAADRTMSSRGQNGRRDERRGPRPAWPRNAERATRPIRSHT